MNSEVVGRIEDLRKLHNDDVNQLNSKFTKKIEELNFAVQGIDKDLEEIERRRVNGENDILKKAFQFAKDGSIDNEIMDIKRRLYLVEQEWGKPREGGRGKIEDERIVKDIIQGMADFESAIKDIKRLQAEHDTDIQDTAKLIHILDQQNTKNKEMFDIINRRLDSLDLLKDAVAKEKVDWRKSIDDLRLAWEAEFNAVKKAEIDDINKLNTKINSLIALQDVVEHLANKLNQVEQEIEGVRFERKVSPIKITNKVAADNVVSSMSQLTKLYSDNKNKKGNTITFDESVNIPTNIRNKSPSTDFQNKNDKFSSPDIKVRDGNPTRATFGRMYTDEYGLRNADYVKIEDDIVHKDDIKYKLNGDNMDSSTPHKCKFIYCLISSSVTLKDLITNSAIPDNYKVSQINDEGKRARSNNSSQRRSKVRDSSASKYSYSKQKEVNQLATGDKVESKFNNLEYANINTNFYLNKFISII